MSVDIRPRKLTVVCRMVAALVLGSFAVLALLLNGGQSEGQIFGPADQIAFFGIGVLLALAVLSLTRSRVQGDLHGIRVRNVVGERFFPWQIVVGVHLPEGASWAQLELYDDETVALLALQTSDGKRTIDAIVALRKLLQAHPGS